MNSLQNFDNYDTNLLDRSSNVFMIDSDYDQMVNPNHFERYDTLISETDSKKKTSTYWKNRDKVLQYQKLRYKQNRDKLLAYSKQYQSERKDMVKEKNSKYYAKHKERLLADRGLKIECSCGRTITKGSYSGHLKSSYHLSRVTLTTNTDAN